MNWAMLWAGSVLLLIGGGLYFFERTKLSARQISVIVVLATLAGVSRIPFAAWPSVQPTTFVVMMSGFVFGPLAGFVVGLVAALVSNCFLGHGAWTLWQMLGWSLCGLSLGLLGERWPKLSLKWMALVGVLWGLLFGWLTNVWHWLAFVYPLTWESWWATNVLSFGFDLQHGFINGVLVLALGGWCLRLLKKYHQRL